MAKALLGFRKEALFPVTDQTLEATKEMLETTTKALTELYEVEASGKDGHHIVQNLGLVTKNI
jgi:hypothetical protein